MPLRPGKKELTRFTGVLEADYETVEDAAKALLNEAWAMYEARGKWSLVGELSYSGGYPSPEEAKANRICLGYFATENQAITAAKSLAYNTQTHEEFRSWVLPAHHGTPAEFFKERKKAREDDGVITPAERLVIKCTGGLPEYDDDGNFVRWATIQEGT